jgi:hypothetical protein
MDRVEWQIFEKEGINLNENKSKIKEKEDKIINEYSKVTNIKNIHIEKDVKEKRNVFSKGGSDSEQISGDDMLSHCDERSSNHSNSCHVNFQMNPFLPLSPGKLAFSPSKFSLSLSPDVSVSAAYSSFDDEVFFFFFVFLLLLLIILIKPIIVKD